MREFLNGDTFFNVLAMLMDEKPDLFLVVEGDYDELALKHHVRGGLSVLPGTGGREHVLKAAELALKRGYVRAKFLVDRDYDPFVTSSTARPQNVLASSGHDLFMDLIQSDPSAMGRLIQLYLPKGNQSPSGDGGSLLRDHLEAEAISLAAKLGAVRIVSMREGLKLNFRAANLGGNLAGAESIAEIVNFLVAANRRTDVDAALLTRQADEVYSRSNGVLDQIVGDHDLLDALGGLLRRAGATVGKSELQRTLTFGTTCRAISSNAWFDLIQEWCRRAGASGFECETPKQVAA